MNRRDFFRTAGMAAGASMLSRGALKAQDMPPKQNFKLKYAPHFGMFENSAGKDLVDQINFIADVGFRAFEDNGMKGRSAGVQEKIAAAMSKRNIQMGVFVAHIVHWDKATLTTGDQSAVDEFLMEIKSSVEVDY